MKLFLSISSGPSSLFLIALAAAPLPSQGLVATVPESVGMSSERLGRLTDVIQEYVDTGRLPGAVVMILRHGHVAYERAFGSLDREAGTPMRDDTIFRIASQTKAVVSVGVMILQEHGKVLLRDPVGKYLPEYMETTVAVAREGSGGGFDVVPASRPITIRDLLTHTAGIGYGGGTAAQLWKDAGIQGWYFAHLEEPIREIVRRMAVLPMDAQPGERYVYGYNTDILGALIEVVSGRALYEFLREEILEPLGMRDTHFYLPRDKAKRLSVVYSVRNGSLERAPDEGTMTAQGAYLDGPRVSFSGGAGLLSTAGDYARFLQMLLNGGELDGKRILSPTTVDLMTVNHLDDVEFPWSPGAGFGLGFEILQDSGRFGEPGAVGTFSWGGAYHSTYWVDPEHDMVVVYFTQVIPADNLDDHAKLRALVYQAIID